MGYWYWRALKEAMVLDESATNRFDLPERGALSALLINLYATNEITLDEYDNPYPFQRTTLRVVGNGNVELVNLKGKQLVGINFWELPNQPTLSLVQWDANTNSSSLLILFGRYLGDPKYGLHLDKFASGVQVEETNTFSTTYYADGYCKWDVYGLFRKDPEPGLFSGGYLRKRQIIDKDTASETQYAVKLPTVNKLRQIHLFTEPDISSHLPATTPWTNVQKVWLSVKSREEYIINNMYASLLSRFMADHFGKTATTKVAGAFEATATYVDTLIYDLRESVASLQHASAGMIREDANTWLERIAKMYTYDTSGTLANRTFMLYSRGNALCGQLPLLMTNPVQSDEADWLDANVMKDVYVEVTEGASTGNWQIVLDELEKTYPS